MTEKYPTKCKFNKTKPDIYRQVMFYPPSHHSYTPPPPPAVTASRLVTTVTERADDMDFGM